MTISYTLLVIIKLFDRKVNFKEMSIAKRKVFVTALYDCLDQRPIKDSYIPRGKDLFVVPVYTIQQKAILNLNDSVKAARKILGSLPKSIVASNKGIISGVPISDDVNDILEVLSDCKV